MAFLPKKRSGGPENLQCHSKIDTHCEQFGYQIFETRKLVTKGLHKGSCHHAYKFAGSRIPFIYCIYINHISYHINIYIYISYIILTNQSFFPSSSHQQPIIFQECIAFIQIVLRFWVPRFFADIQQAKAPSAVAFARTYPCGHVDESQTKHVFFWQNGICRLHSSYSPTTCCFFFQHFFLPQKVTNLHVRIAV